MGKFVKVSVHTYALNNLTSFKLEVHVITGKGNDENLLKSYLFLAGFSH